VNIFANKCVIIIAYINATLLLAQLKRENIYILSVMVCDWMG
jgi:hypothetical protein